MASTLPRVFREGGGHLKNFARGWPTIDRHWACRVNIPPVRPAIDDLLPGAIGTGDRSRLARCGSTWRQPNRS